MNAVGGTDIVGAGWHETVMDAVAAKVTLLGNFPLIIKSDGMIGACLHAGFTTGTACFIQDNDPVIPFADGLHRTCFGTGWVFTVPAKVNLVKEVQHAGIFPRPIFRNTDELNAVTCLVFLFAGYLTRFTAPAGFIIDPQNIFLHEHPLQFFQV
jgi:hypothetical protein